MQHGTNRTIDGTCGPFRLAEATIASAQIAMERGEVTAHELTRLYL